MMRVEPEEQPKPVIANTTTTLSHETGINEDDLVSLLRTSYEMQQKDVDQAAARRSLDQDGKEVRACPMCCYEFPANMTVEQKTEHIEGHFQ